MHAHAAMNRIYRLVWNEVLGAWVAVAENARGRGKGAARALTSLALVAIGLLLPVLAAPPVPTQLPTGGQVVAGSATLAQSGARLDINQTSQRGAIDWQSFNVGAQAQVNFNQPSSSAVTLNRVLDSQPSQIFGRITANGQVFLTNPNGVLFGPSASVDVGGLVATTHGMSNADFMAGSNTFSRDGASGSVINEGSLNANLGGYIALLAPEVRNSGVIVANAGTVALAAGDVIELQFDSNHTLAGLRTTPSTIAALVENRLAVQAPGGQIILSAQAVNQLQGGVVKNSGSISATSMVNDGGTIRLVGDQVQLDTGSSVSANGTRGGQIDIQAKRVLQSGSIEANGSRGGTISIKASDQILQTTLSTTTADGSTGPGGSITLQAGNTLFSSGTVSAQGDKGGTIHALANTVVLAAANLNASGKTGGGTVLVGGDFQGKNPLIPNAQTVNINPSTQIKADAQISGQGGKAIVWSDDQTTFYGHISAKGGAQGGNGGQIEVSGKQDLVYGGVGDASAPLGAAGSLLLDPANIVISSAGSLPSYSFIDPNATSGGAFGVNIVPLASGNVVVTASQDTVGGVTTAGAVYLYNGLTGGLISALTGSQSGDQVGSEGITQLTNGNYVVSSTNWANGALAQAGAATWASGVTGVNGAVSSINSLVGGKGIDQIGIDGITALTNGNYVVRSTYWDNGANFNAGAVTWGDGSIGVVGVVTAVNSLVGSTAYDYVGQEAVVALTNGNYVVVSKRWDNGAVVDAGAVTWGNGSTGITGVVSAANSLVGSQASDFIGNDGVTALTNGNYVVASTLWDNAAVVDAGAATWGNGTTGITGVVSSANSLVGSATNDEVGVGVTALTNGNYVVSSHLWNLPAVVDVGAVTWGNGTTGITGVVSVANSLIGSSTNDQVGFDGATALTNGNYVVSSRLWDNGAAFNAGAATWGNGTTGISGAVSAANSLVGTTATDQVSIGGITALTNGHYVVRSKMWNNGAITQVGAVTWGNGTTGISGAVSATNSLVGSAANDQVGSDGVIALTNGHYVVVSPYWDNGATTGAGAVTWGNGTSGISGAVSAANSLVGGQTNDFVGYTDNAPGVTALANGNYVVISAAWHNGALANAGAVTWGNGTTGITGTVSAANSLVGSQTNDWVGRNGTTALANGHYVAVSPWWSNGATANVGAVTWGNGTTGITGVVSGANSLLGTVASQFLGATVADDTVNNTFVVGDNAGLSVQAVFADPNLITSTRGGGATFTITPSLITNTLDTGTAVTLQATNNITINSAITAVGNGALTMQAGGSVTVNAPISVLGALTLRGTDITSSDITLNAAVSSTAAGDSVVLAAGRNFINNVGAGAINPGAGRFLVYSTNPVADTRGGHLYDFKQYNTAYGGGVLGSGDGFIYTLAPTITAALDLASSVSKTYDGALTATLAGGNYGHSGAIDGDTVTLNNPASGSFDTKDAGVGKTVSVSGLSIASASNGAATVYGYQLASTTASAAIGTITPKALTLTGMTATNRVYDGSTSVVLAGGALSGLVGAETLTFSGQTGAFADKNVGVGKGVTVSGVTLADGVPAFGGLASNYTVSNPVGLTANITARTLNVSATGINRVYDGTTGATVTLGDDRVGGDVLTFGSTSSFADKNVGVGKAVSVTGISLGGADAGNYSLAATTASTSADITQRTLTLTFTGVDKVYNGSTIAPVNVVNDKVAGDSIAYFYTAAFADKNVGTAKPVSVTGIALTGITATNYVLASTTASTSADITARTLNVSATGINRVYDGTTTATVTLGDDRVGGDVLSFASSASFADKNVGVGKAVSVTGISVGGADAGNYSANASTATTANITPRTLTVNATGTNRVYDGSTVAIVTLGDDRVAGDVLTLSNTSANFTDVNVGAGKTINVLGIGVAGTDAGNYALSSTSATTMADILPVGTTLLVGPNSSLIAPPGSVGLVVGVNPGAPLVSNPVIGTVDPSFGLPQAPNTGGTNLGAPTANVGATVNAKDDKSTQSQINPSVNGGNTRRGFNPSALLFDAYGRPNSLDQLIQGFDPSSHHALRLDARQSIDEMARSFLQSPLFGMDANGQGAVDTMGAIGAHAQQALLTSMNEVWGQLDALKQQTERHLSDRQQITLGVTAGALVVSAGYLIWLLAGGSLAFLSLAFLPLWRGFDPLPVLDKKKRSKKDEIADRASAEALAAERRVRALMGPRAG